MDLKLNVEFYIFELIRVVENVVRAAEPPTLRLAHQ